MILSTNIKKRQVFSVGSIQFSPIPIRQTANRVHDIDPAPLQAGEREVVLVHLFPRLANEGPAGGPLLGHPLLVMAGGLPDKEDVPPWAVAGDAAMHAGTQGAPLH